MQREEPPVRNACDWRPEWRAAWVVDMVASPANPGAMPQLSRLALRIGRRAELPPEARNVPIFDNMLFSSRELAEMLQGRRRIADTLGAWVPF